MTGKRERGEHTNETNEEMKTQKPGDATTHKILQFKTGRNAGTLDPHQKEKGKREKEKGK
jgi:hypothetical protein